ncbi:MAG: hypothetical protein ABIJ95_01760, partial [Pseudomonadota bacterium]
REDLGPRETGYFYPGENVSAATDHDLQRMVKTAYRRFYLSPKRAWRTARVIPKTPAALFSVGLALQHVFRNSHI